MAASASRRAPTHAQRAWTALLRGAWVVVGVVEREGRRYIVARAAKKGSRGAEGLTRRELVAIRFVSAGLSYKHLALELGVSSATAGRVALTALEKLGVASRVELAALLGR